MRKRRCASSVASRGADGDDRKPSNPGPPPSRKKKLDPGKMCQQLYNTIRSHKNEDGSLLCTSFIRTPNRRREPQYYELVSNPIDLSRVQLRLKADPYEDIEELSADIELLVNNAKAFYKPDSVEYKDANDLWKLYSLTKQALENGEEIKTPKLSRNGSSSRRSDVAEDISETSTNNEEDIYEELFSAVMTANADGRPLYPAFQFPPSKRRYPEYYNVIDNPIDLKTIAAKIQGGEYVSLTELERDLKLMVRNACAFNEPGSQIYKDAIMLKKVIQVSKQEIDQHGRSGPAKISERIRSKRTSRVEPVPTSKEMAMMEPPDNEESVVKHSEDGAGESDKNKIEDKNSPFWKLYETVKNLLGATGRSRVSPIPVSTSPAPSPSIPRANLPLKKKLRYIVTQLLEFTYADGRQLILPFMEKPSEELYPDYYNVIERPIDMITIAGNIKNDRYNSLEEMVSDFRLMFSNCRQFNEEGSIIYDDANLLERVLNYCLKELHSGGNSAENAAVLRTFKGAEPKPLSPLEHKLMQQRVQEVLDIVQSSSSDDESFSTSQSQNTSRSKGRSRVSPIPVSSSYNLPLKKKLRFIVKQLLEFTCTDVRQLILPFIEKPSQELYPVYYNVIERPIDMITIAGNIKNDRYNSLEEMVSDFRLMFSNCRQFNEEGSLIYNDANLLERELNDCLKELHSGGTSEDNAAVLKTFERAEPKSLSPLEHKLMQQRVQEVLDIVESSSSDDESFSAVKSQSQNASRSKGRSRVSPIPVSSSYNLPLKKKLRFIVKQLLEFTCTDVRQLILPFIEKPSQELYPVYYNVIERPIDMITIAGNIKNDRYNSLEEMVSDFRLMFSNCRQFNQEGSIIYDDANLLERVLNDCLKELHSGGTSEENAAVLKTFERVEPKPLSPLEHKSSTDDSMPAGSAPLQQTQYNKGDFVYVQPEKGNKEPAIVQVERVWTNKEGVPMMDANVYFRPHETFHVRTRKFLKQEVFKTEIHRSIPLDQVKDHCYVMNVNENSKFRPEGYSDKDVYVCESSYSTRHRWFHKLL